MFSVREDLAEDPRNRSDVKSEHHKFRIFRT